MLGGSGSDLVMGGAGSDFVFGAGPFFDSLPDRPTDPPLGAPGIELTRGFGWVTSSSDYAWEGDRSWGGSVERSCELMNKNRIEGASKQGERARNREALVIKAQAA